MAWIVQQLWVIAALPLAAGGVIAVTPRQHRRFAATLAIGSMAVALALAIVAFVHVFAAGSGEAAREYVNVPWFQFGDQWLYIGWVLDRLNAVMLVMVTFVGLLIFVYSTSYMAEDENFTRFFCFVALFAGAMLGVVVANNLLLLFMCWEVVGLTSYLLIGFWYERPQAAAAAKKAFIVTRIGDLGFFLGMAWLYATSGTLLFYDHGRGAIEASSLQLLASHATIAGLTLSAAIGLLIFCGAAGKSGQVPLHVWLPDAMEGPTPVSALIHAATMVAAGVFLIARVYPLLSAQSSPSLAAAVPVALMVVTWVGAITALFGSIVAVAQWDIKRILAYSTVSQLGYMMIGLGTGGVGVGMFHLITHAFFKALLFLGAGSVIHGCAGEQDIRRMGGLSKPMRVTFIAYSFGMLALCGFPLFAGFWSKDDILHAAFLWGPTRVPFLMGALGAFLTAFYMTRQMMYVFFGSSRTAESTESNGHHGHAAGPHESPLRMTVPLCILAVFALLLGFLGTPAWPWFQSFVSGESLQGGAHALWTAAPLMLVSTVIVLLGLGAGWMLYGPGKIRSEESPDVLEEISPKIFSFVENAFYIDRLYRATIVSAVYVFGSLCAWLDRWVWGGAVWLVSFVVTILAELDRVLDTSVVNKTFDATCASAATGGNTLSRFQGGQVQRYMKVVGVAVAVGVVLLIWGTR